MTSTPTAHQPPDAAAPAQQSTTAAPSATDAEDTRDDAAGQAEGTGMPTPEFCRLEDWLTGYFLPMFRRTLGGEYRWCRQWWRHGEAISRLTALWHSWEVLRTQPGTGIASWYRDHLDHQLPILLGARGPFYQCSETTHREPHQATADPPPTGWWDTDAEDERTGRGMRGGELGANETYDHSVENGRSRDGHAAPARARIAASGRTAKAG